MSKVSLFKRNAIILTMLTVQTDALAAENVNDSTQIQLNKNNEDVLDNIEKSQEENDLPNKLNTSNTEITEEKQKSIEYLKNNPAEFEKLLQLLLKQANDKALAQLLPEYEKIPNHDQSVIDWGNAIIKGKKGKLKEAIKDFELLKSKLPNVRLIQFHLAMALFFDRQYQAAKKEFVDLKSRSNNEKDNEIIDKYIASIDRKTQWNFDGNISLLSDDNITDLAPVGTKIDGSNKSSVTQTTKLQSGKGFNFGLSASKKWLDDSGYYLNTEVSANGKVYVNNKKYNDVNISLSEGFGYQNGITDVQLAPYYRKYFYANGTRGNGKLIDFSDTYGLSLKVNQWLNRQLKYQLYGSYGKTFFTDEFKINDSNNTVIANNLIFLAKPDLYFNLGYSFAKKDVADKSDAYTNKNVSVGAGKSWPLGFNTNTSVAVGRKQYKGKDFTGIQRKNKELNFRMSIWNKNLVIWGLVPKLGYSYRNIHSNSAFEKRNNHDFTFDLSKSF